MDAEILRTIISCILTSACAGMIGLIVKIFRTLGNVKQGVRAMLREHLMEIYDEYIRYGTGAVPEMKKRQVEDIYTAYHSLGGNGVGTAIKDAIVKAPAADTSPIYTTIKENRERLQDLESEAE